MNQHSIRRWKRCYSYASISPAGPKYTGGQHRSKTSKCSDRRAKINMSQDSHSPETTLYYDQASQALSIAFVTRSESGSLEMGYSVMPCGPILTYRLPRPRHRSHFPRRRLSICSGTFSFELFFRFHSLCLHRSRYASCLRETCLHVLSQGPAIPVPPLWKVETRSARRVTNGCASCFEIGALHPHSLPAIMRCKASLLRLPFGNRGDGKETETKCLGKSGGRR